MSRRVFRARYLAVAAAFTLAVGRSNAQNLIPDPHFSSGTSAWNLLLTGGITATLVRDPGPGVDGAPGFATLTGGNFGPIGYLARTCIPVQPGVVYSSGGVVRFLSSQSSTVFLAMTFFSDAGCVTALPPPPIVPGSNAADARTPGAWTPLLGSGAAAPTAAATAALDLILNGTSTSERPAVDFDDVFAGRAGTVGPATPVPLLSRAGLLALGVALALAGVLLLQPGRR